MTGSIDAPPLMALKFNPGRILIGFIIALGLLFAITLELPSNEYIMYQQFASGDLSRLRWVYERMHFDTTPIDVAIIGNSRAEASISAPELEKSLSADFGRPIHVANLAVPAEGRNLHFVIVKELLRSHPETRLVLLSLAEPIKRSHPAFRSVGALTDVIGSPIWINYYWLEDVSYLPYRQLSLFLQSLAPRFFRMNSEFDRTAYRGTDFDTTKSFRLDNKKLVDRESLANPTKLAVEVAERPPGGHRSILARLTGADENIVENTFTKALSIELSRRCIGLVLVHLPIFKGSPSDVDIDTNTKIAPVLITPATIGSDWTDFSDGAHLRRPGIDKVSRWLPRALAPYVEQLKEAQGRRSCESTETARLKG